jgi:hypothetical protein
MCKSHAIYHKDWNKELDCFIVPLSLDVPTSMGYCLGLNENMDVSKRDNRVA